MMMRQAKQSWDLWYDVILSATSKKCQGRNQRKIGLFRKYDRAPRGTARRCAAGLALRCALLSGADDAPSLANRLGALV